MEVWEQFPNSNQRTQRLKRRCVVIMVSAEIWDAAMFEHRAEEKNNLT